MTTSDVYIKLKAVAGSSPSNFAAFIWHNCAPPRVKFFGWLLVQGRIQCRLNLVKKNVLTNSSCELCGQGESCDHIMFHCQFALTVWTSLGIDTTNATVAALWTVARPTTVPKRHFPGFLLLICWLLWKQRNALVFQQVQPCHTSFWAQCREEARLWSLRLKQDDRCVADAWCLLFSSM